MILEIDEVLRAKYLNLNYVWDMNCFKGVLKSLYQFLKLERCIMSANREPLKNFIFPSKTFLNIFNADHAFQFQFAQKSLTQFGFLFRQQKFPKNFEVKIIVKLKKAKIIRK